MLPILADPPLDMPAPDAAEPDVADEPPVEPAGDERRNGERIDVSFTGTLEELCVRIGNVSRSGLLLHIERDLVLWSERDIVLPGMAARRMRIVRRDGDFYGCLFRIPLDEAEVDALIEYDRANPPVVDVAPRSEPARNWLRRLQPRR